MPRPPSASDSDRQSGTAGIGDATVGGPVTGDAEKADPGQSVPPPGEPALRTIAMPADTNPNGDIFGGWLLAQMDLAGAVPAWRRAQGRVATIALDGVVFHQPVYVGDLLSLYADIVSVGRTSMKVRVLTYVTRRVTGEMVRVTEGVFTYVAIGEDRRPRAVPVE